MGNLVSVEVKGNVGTIDDNLTAVEQSIREKVAEYSAVVVTEDSIADGKRFLADVRKEKKELDAQRKEIKRQWMAPYERFEKRVKEVIALYDEPERVFNSQLQEYEEMRKEARRQEIREAYDFVKGDLGEWLPLERIYNPKWENKGTAPKKIREDMELLFDQMKLSISTIQAMNSEFEFDGLEVLKKTGSLQDAIAEINSLQKQKERFAEQARLEAEEKLRREAEERQKQEEEARRQEEEKLRMEAKESQKQEEQAEPVAVEEETDFPEDTFGEPLTSVSDTEREWNPFPEVFPPVPEDFMNPPEETVEPAKAKEFTVTVKVSAESLGLLEGFLQSMDLIYEVQ